MNPSESPERPEQALAALERKRAGRGPYPAGNRPMKVEFIS